MQIRLSEFMTLEARYLVQRNGIYQLCLRVPVELSDRYKQKFIRQSLRTKDKRVALQRLQPLVQHYLAEFDRLRFDDQSVPTAVITDARELAKLIEENESATELLFEPRRLAHAQKSADPEYTYFNADPAEYLNPVEAQAIKMAKAGLDKPLLSDALAMYLRLHPKGSDAKFQKSTQREWLKLVAHCGDVACDSLTRQHAHSFADQLRETGLKTTSVRRSLRTINAVLNMAFTEFEIAKVQPFRSLKISGEGLDAREAEVPSEDQLEVIAKQLDSSDSTTSIIAAIMLETGPRMAEISGLKVADVVLEAVVPYLRIRPNEWRSTKNLCSQRDVPLVGLSLKAAQKAVEQAGDSDALFPQYARTRGNDSASAAVNKLLKPFGITSKSFRHSLKDRLREAGCPQDIRDAIQGHSNRSIAETYGKGHTLQTMHHWLLKAKVT